jgi:hypothetical protein
LTYNMELGLCQGLKGSVKVCAAGTQGVSRLSARTWFDLEVNNRAAYINDKTLVKGDQAYVKLYRTLNTKICRQVVAIPVSSRQPMTFNACSCVLHGLGLTSSPLFQMGPTVSPKTTLSDNDQQDMACNFVWRRCG